MKNQENNSNLWIVVLAFIIGVLLSSWGWYYFSKPAPPIITNGSFKAVKPVASHINSIPVAQNLITEPIAVNTEPKSLSTEVEKFKNLYNLTKKEYDSLLVYNSFLDSLANASNDKRYQKLYSDCKAVAFSQLFDNDTIKATVSGISHGAPERIKLDWQLKLPKPKEMVFRLSTGSSFSVSRSFKKINAQAIISGQFKSGAQILIGYDTDNWFHLGGTIPIFQIKK